MWFLLLVCYYVKGNFCPKMAVFPLFGNIWEKICPWDFYCISNILENQYKIKNILNERIKNGK